LEEIMSVQSISTSASQSTTHPALSLPAALIKLENVAFFVSAAAAFYRLEGSLLLLPVLFLTPDLSMLGYLINPNAGSKIYNSVHTYTVPIIVAALALLAGSVIGVQIALIWIMHIAFDRIMGYGLKYATAFKDTHLQRI